MGSQFISVTWIYLKLWDLTKSTEEKLVETENK